MVYTLLKWHLGFFASCVGHSSEVGFLVDLKVQAHALGMKGLLSSPMKLRVGGAKPQGVPSLT